MNIMANEICLLIKTVFIKYLYSVEVHLSTLLKENHITAQLTALGAYLKICDGDIGTDSRVGVGFRLGDHADFQVLLELGPQLNTQPLGPAGGNKTRRQVQRPALVVLPATGSETVADTPRGKWLSSWRSALVNSQPVVRVLLCVFRRLYSIKRKDIFG
jgi:hypothetical protein